MERMLLILKRSPEQESALGKLLDEQLDQTSLNFHKWLTPDEFGQKFGPSSEDIRSVTSWLESHGFRVARVSKRPHCD
jgi:subtilase family serine protease